uniref:Uncharacterized protein n=1 Tax=Rhizophora mucronata TaxID=61149 RepID=A0A2P2QR15_RHIMU
MQTPLPHLVSNQSHNTLLGISSFLIRSFLKQQ